MATPTVDTFEHDIANEIRHKEASITDIATAVGDIGNQPESQKSGKALIISVVVLLISGIIGAGYVGYLYSSGSMGPAKKPTSIEMEQKKVKAGAQVSSISPTLDQAVGTFLTNVQKTKSGYSINVISYSPVFAYMLKNENAFADELGLALGNSHTIKTTQAATSTPIVLATTTQATGTSTQKTSTSTTEAASTTTQAELPTSYTFSDITISNQNMRIATSVYGTVVYAFIGTQKLVIANSPEGILALRSSILQK